MGEEKKENKEKEVWGVCRLLAEEVEKRDCERVDGRERAWAEQRN